MLLLKKKDKELIASSFIPSDPSHAAKAMPQIRRYANDIHLNRAAMKQSARRLNEAGDLYKVVIWGGGRIFDALVRFGELDMSKVYLLVDKYLHRYVDTLYGCRLTSPDTLRREAPETLLLYIASRDYADEIYTEASAMGITNFIRFSTE